MPEAVIIDAVRTPIGRAFKGSLREGRPDDLGAYVLDQLLARNAAVDAAPLPDGIPRRGPGRHHRLRHDAGRAALQHRPHHGAAVGEAARPRDGLDYRALLRVVA